MLAHEWDDDLAPPVPFRWPAEPSQTPQDHPVSDPEPETRTTGPEP